MIEPGRGDLSLLTAQFATEIRHSERRNERRNGEENGEEGKKEEGGKTPIFVTSAIAQAAIEGRTAD